MSTVNFPENWLAFTGLTLQDLPKIEEEAYPPEPLRFKALELVPPEAVKVVILGQDPYHGKGEAHGLAFSVPEGVKIPPSLRNIFQEISADLSLPVSKHTDLTRWALQGVLLLNTALSVAPNQAGSHAKKGWEKVTDAIIQALGRSKQPLAFILWGKPAQAKKKWITGEHHLIVESAHPSPLSAHRGFFGSRPFSKVNQWLQSQHLTPVDWR